MKQQPWMGRASVDIPFILLPPFLCLLIIALWPGLFQQDRDMPQWTWVVLVLLIDVAHVYSTLYRTYFDPLAFQKQRKILTAIPVVGFIVGVLLYSISDLLFWRILAYTAVFHFVRQQYGFMRVYSRQEPRTGIRQKLDTITIYAATLYPLLYWHTRGPRNFNWFIPGDFFYFSAEWIQLVSGWAYLFLLIVYWGWVVRDLIRHRYLNIPKQLIMLGTMASWYFGIVYFNGDMAFTLLNVVSHGIPYMALIWIYGDKNYVKKKTGSRFLQWIFSNKGIVAFLAILFILAFVEEGLWDWMVWKERSDLFGAPVQIRLSNQLLALLVPLLALPQITHYILDGFIWKIRHNDIRWSNESRQHPH